MSEKEEYHTTTSRSESNSDTSSSHSGDKLSRSKLEICYQCHVCQRCSKTFSSEADVVQHLQNDQCNVISINDLRNVDNIRVTTNSLDSKPMESPSKYMDEMKLSHGDGDKDQKIYECFDCGVIFSSAEELTQHLGKQHAKGFFICKIKNSDYSENAGFSCSTLEKQNEKSLIMCENQKSEYSDGPGFSCSTCGKMFSSKGNLMKHQAYKHTGFKPYQCSYCEKQFSVKGNMEKHQLIHTNTRNFRCEICDKEFILKGNLQQHMLTHTSSKGYSCHICSKEFTLKGNLDKHIKRHAAGLLKTGKPELRSTTPVSSIPLRTVRMPSTSNSVYNKNLVGSTNQVSSSTTLNNPAISPSSDILGSSSSIKAKVQVPSSMLVEGSQMKEYPNCNYAILVQPIPVQSSGANNDVSYSTDSSTASICDTPSNSNLLPTETAPLTSCDSNSSMVAKTLPTLGQIETCGPTVVKKRLVIATMPSLQPQTLGTNSNTKVNKISIAQARTTTSETHTLTSDSSMCEDMKIKGNNSSNFSKPSVNWPVAHGSSSETPSMKSARMKSESSESLNNDSVHRNTGHRELLQEMDAEYICVQNL